MQNNDYLFPGVAAIFLAMLVPLYWLGMATSVTDSDILWQDMMSLGLSDIVFAAIPLLTSYVYLKLKTILNERWNVSQIDLLIFIMVAINILWVSTLLLDVTSALSSESSLAQNRETFLSIGTSVGVGGLFLFGVVDLLIGIFLLTNATELPSLLKAFAVLSIIQGVLGITVILAALLIFIFPVTLIILALLFLRKPESIEIV
jgi:hypothetical protein